MSPQSIIFCFHFVFDFLLQSREMGQNKSKNYVFLLAHIAIVSIGIMLGSYIVFKNFNTALEFSFWNGVWHLIIDATMWNIYAISAFFRYYGIDEDPFTNHNNKWGKLAEKWEWQKDHWFFATIGLDQLLHFITIQELYLRFTQ